MSLFLLYCIGDVFFSLGPFFLSHLVCINIHSCVIQQLSRCPTYDLRNRVKNGKRVWSIGHQGDLFPSCSPWRWVLQKDFCKWALTTFGVWTIAWRPIGSSKPALVEVPQGILPDSALPRSVERSEHLPYLKAKRLTWHSFTVGRRRQAFWIRDKELHYSA